MMNERPKLVWGAEAGLLAGVAVAAIFFVGDAVHLTPLSTPTALGRTFVGPGGLHLTGDFPDGSVAAVTWAANLLALSLIHLLSFALLGVGAVLLFRRAGWRLNALTGALYGALACTGVFYLSMAAAGATVARAGLPSPIAVVAANLVAGAIIGGGVALMGDSAAERPAEAA